MWEIIDNKGVIHSGSEEEMQQAFSIMTQPDSWWPEVLIEKYRCEWEGDLRLIQVHKTYR